jgi:hypothetical protein
MTPKALGRLDYSLPIGGELCEVGVSRKVLDQLLVIWRLDPITRDAAKDK